MGPRKREGIEGESQAFLWSAKHQLDQRETEIVEIFDFDQLDDILLCKDIWAPFKQVQETSIPLIKRELFNNPWLEICEFKLMLERYIASFSWQSLSTEDVPDSKFAMHEPILMAVQHGKANLQGVFDDHPQVVQRDLRIVVIQIFCLKVLRVFGEG